ncbi:MULTISPECIES: GNAT family N-acetyltransferase [unclassified Methanoculleus]|uniref:GNAT family N-acetyltransferase n=1 Tax=unclassified Methanoculleus TaxID=2619537 RepID=UPI0025EC8B7E|nr:MULTISPECIES: GNAT family N-acetyltransferase [unclassified Methanoculleus]MCK9317511.1 GNAT family N-acetyltransferase [Methanoculleus sp.]MDD2252937.1 GNAT family N-acetyltransferase [Methanoculleus sp.]MDD2786960.1 GNAT family N-acetyltransferase [Methanoculleus sp.]MDD3215912.1 GNAT family N-acetyltransferase [Methanoculleus sp.]MDD4313662.1 GNAT family N-acetyltransferase [Methanoculleus sp.]
MIGQPVLATGRLLLRPFTLADAAEVQRLAGDYAIASSTLSIPYPYPDGAAEAWIATHRPGFEKGMHVVYAVTRPDDGTLVGAAGLVEIDRRHGRAELGYWVGRPYQGRGYATEAARAVIEYGFSVLELHRVYALHLSRNPASGRVMEKCGMVYEAHLREHGRKWGIFEDLDVRGILHDEWRERCTAPAIRECRVG